MAEPVEQAEVVETGAIPAGKMEFRLINPTEKGFLRAIKWNKEELEEAVRAKIASYENVVYTEDDVKQAKSDRAELNKLKKAIEDRRKTVKELVTQPYDTFKKEVDDVLKLIDEPVTLIDKQVKEFETRQKEEKKAELQKIFEESVGNLAGVISFERVFDQRYLNQTFKLAAAQIEIRDKLEHIRADLETIDGLESKYKLNAKDVYIQTLDLSKALAENRRLTELEEKLEVDRKRKEEEAKQKEAERLARIQEAENKIAEAYAQKLMESVKGQAYNSAVDPFKTQPVVTEKKYKTRFWAAGTREQLAGLTRYMKEHDINFGKVE